MPVTAEIAVDMKPVIIKGILTSAPMNRAKKFRTVFLRYKMGCSPRQLEKVMSRFQGEKSVLSRIPTEKKCQKNFR